MVPYKGDKLSTTTIITAQTSLTKAVPSSSSSLSSSTTSRPHLYQRKTAPDPSRLAPEDALTLSQIRLAARGVEEYHRPVTANGSSIANTGGLAARVTAATTTTSADARRKREKAVLEGSGVGGGSGSRRRRVWKKLLWVKQSYPDNYTDEATFLDHLQRNPRLQPYEFWPLMEGLTVIVQHVCSVIIFICCFVAIFQERICPKVIAIMASIATITGWVLWSIWIPDTEGDCSDGQDGHDADREDELSSSSASSASTLGLRKSKRPALGAIASRQASRDFLATENTMANGGDEGPATSARSNHQSGASRSEMNISQYPTSGGLNISLQNRRRLATIKSALLIYCAVLGLSPILKSLTRSTSSDSIWAMSCWLIVINIFFFHYDASSTSKIASPASHSQTRGNLDLRITASLSTNAALMASTLLASRLPSTTHVFSLTLFSIEIFALFPIFRRLLRLRSWRGHVVLTGLLVLGAGGGLNMVIIGPGAGWKAAIIGMVLGSVIIGLAMGLCSWWLIGLQKYKNEIHGPWDPARPIIRVRLD